MSSMDSSGEYCIQADEGEMKQEERVLDLNPFLTWINQEGWEHPSFELSEANESGIPVGSNPERNLMTAGNDSPAIAAHVTGANQDQPQDDPPSGEAENSADDGNKNDPGSGNASGGSGQPPGGDGIDQVISSYSSGTAVNIQALTMPPETFSLPVFTGQAEYQILCINRDIVIGLQTEAAVHMLPFTEYVLTPHQQVRLDSNIVFTIRNPNSEAAEVLVIQIIW